MTGRRKLAHGHKPLTELIRFAQAHGWQVSRTGGGHLRFSKAGCRPVFTSSTPGDHRAVRNARAMLRRQMTGTG